MQGGWWRVVVAGLVALVLVQVLGEAAVGQTDREPSLAEVTGFSSPWSTSVSTSAGTATVQSVADQVGQDILAWHTATWVTIARRPSDRGARPIVYGLRFTTGERAEEVWRRMGDRDLSASPAKQPEGPITLMSSEGPMAVAGLPDAWLTVAFLAMTEPVGPDGAMWSAEVGRVVGRDFVTWTTIGLDRAEAEALVVDLARAHSGAFPPDHDVAFTRLGESGVPSWGLGAVIVLALLFLLQAGRVLRRT